LKFSRPNQDYFCPWGTSRPRPWSLEFYIFRRDGND